MGLAATGAAAGHAGSKGLNFNMAQNLWTLVLFTALIFHGGADGNGTLGTQEGHSSDFACDATHKSYHQTLFSLVGLLECFSCDTARTSLPPAKLLVFNMSSIPEHPKS